jgi:hypothetical protein
MAHDAQQVSPAYRIKRFCNVTFSQCTGYFATMQTFGCQLYSLEVIMNHATLYERTLIVVHQCI